MSEQHDDPVVRSARREALVVFFIWLCAMLYTVLYCYANGYQRDPATLTFILGFPDWVFWGILLPWGICVLLSYWFGHAFVRDADLGRGREEDNDAGDDNHA